MEFSKLVLRLARRARLVQGIERAWPPVALALALMIGYQAARLLGLVSGVKPYLIASAILAVALGGFLWGYLEKIDLPWVLFQADRRLGLNEKISSLYELHRGRGRAEFIPVLSSRLPRRIELSQALPLRRRGPLLLVALLALGVLLGLPQPLSLLHRGPATVEERPAGEREEPLPKLAQIERELAKLQEEVPGLEWGPQQEASRGQAVESLRERLQELGEEVWGPAAPALQEEVREGLAQALSSIEGNPQSEFKLPPELLAKLGQLAGRLPRGLMTELLQQLPRATGAESMKNLLTALSLAEGLAQAGEKLKNYEQLPGQPARQARGEEEGLGETPRGAGEGERPSEEGPPGGEEAGTGRGERSGELSTLSMPAETRELRIPGELGDLGEVEQLLTKGTPFELGAAEEGGPRLELSFQRVSAILEAREIPAGLREVVKRYFLLITEER